MRIRNYYQWGMTALEIIIIVGLSSLLITALTRFMVAGYPVSRTVQLQAQSTETARTQLRRLVHAIRQARESAAGSYPLVEASPNRIIFYADTNGDGIVERIRYELNDTDLERGVILPSGNPLTYSGDNEEVTIVASHVRNTAQDPIFTYYTGDYPADTTPLAPADLTEVKYIQFRLLIDIDPNQSPDPIDMRSQVHLRNLKTNLGQQVN